MILDKNMNLHKGMKSTKIKSMWINILAKENNIFLKGEL